MKKEVLRKFCLFVVVLLTFEIFAVGGIFAEPTGPYGKQSSVYNPELGKDSAGNPYPLSQAITDIIHGTALNTYNGIAAAGNFFLGGLIPYLNPDGSFNWDEWERELKESGDFTASLPPQLAFVSPELKRLSKIAKDLNKAAKKTVSMFGKNSPEAKQAIEEAKKATKNLGTAIENAHATQNAPKQTTPPVSAPPSIPPTRTKPKLTRAQEAYESERVVTNNRELKRIATKSGYDVVEGTKHVEVRDKRTGELVTRFSKGSSSSYGVANDAIKQMATWGQGQ